MRVGDPVLLRSIHRGNVRWCWPHHRMGLYCRPGNRGKLMKRVAGKGYLEHWVTDAPAFDHVWDSSHMLRFMRAGDARTRSSSSGTKGGASSAGT